MRISVLAGPGDSTHILLNWLADQGYQDVQIILEESVSRRKMLRHRLRRLGIVSVAGQIAFMICVLPFLRRRSGARRAALLEAHGLRASPPLAKIIHVPTINVKIVSNPSTKTDNHQDHRRRSHSDSGTRPDPLPEHREPVPGSRHSGIRRPSRSRHQGR